MKYDTTKRQKSQLRNLFRSTPSPIKEIHNKLSFSLLKKLASTKELKDILKLIEHETIPTVRDAWVDYFLEKTRRSECKGN